MNRGRPARRGPRDEKYPQINFSVSPKTKELLQDFISSNDFFLEQFKRGNTPTTTKVVRAALAFFIKTIETKNQKSLALFYELFESSDDVKLVYDCLVDAKNLMEKEAEILR